MSFASLFSAIGDVVETVGESSTVATEAGGLLENPIVRAALIGLGAGAVVWGAYSLLNNKDDEEENDDDNGIGLDRVREIMDDDDTLTEWIKKCAKHGIVLPGVKVIGTIDENGNVVDLEKA